MEDDSPWKSAESHLVTRGAEIRGAPESEGASRADGCVSVVCHVPVEGGAQAIVDVDGAVARRVALTGERDCLIPDFDIPERQGGSACHDGSFRGGPEGVVRLKAKPRITRDDGCSCEGVLGPENHSSRTEGANLQATGTGNLGIEGPGHSRGDIDSGRADEGKRCAIDGRGAQHRDRGCFNAGRPYYHDPGPKVKKSIISISPGFPDPIGGRSVPVQRRRISVPVHRPRNPHLGRSEASCAWKNRSED